MAARLLILDDDELVGQILQTAASLAGCEARLCLEVAAFLGALQAWHPTHLAIDLTLPNSSGSEVLRAVARQPLRPTIIVCSGAGAADLDAALAESRALGLPTAGALAKPYSLVQVRTLLSGGP